MVIITGKIAKIPLSINPYLTLGIKKGASKSETKIKFREKLNAAMNDDELRAKICFAYDIIVNNSFYIVFTIKMCVIKWLCKQGLVMTEKNKNDSTYDNDTHEFTVIQQQPVSKNKVISSLIWKFLERGGVQGVQFILSI